jgi:uncharacterized protein
MKYAVVILVVLLGFWLWKKNRADERAQNSRDSDATPKRKSNAPSGTPQIMVSCAVCGVHLPQTDAVMGKFKHYCSLAHRQQKEP